MAVPFKMMYSVAKVKQNPKLTKIIDNFPDCFNKAKTGDADHLTLCLGVFYEVSIGKLSYWYPWLRLILDIKVPRNGSHGTGWSI